MEVSWKRWKVCSENPCNERCESKYTYMEGKRLSQNNCIMGYNAIIVWYGIHKYYSNTGTCDGRSKIWKFWKYIACHHWPFITHTSHYLHNQFFRESHTGITLWEIPADNSYVSNLPFIFRTRSIAAMEVWWMMKIVHSDIPELSPHSSQTKTFIASD